MLLGFSPTQLRCKYCLDIFTVASTFPPSPPLFGGFKQKGKLIFPNSVIFVAWPCHLLQLAGPTPLSWRTHFAAVVNFTTPAPLGASVFSSTSKSVASPENFSFRENLQRQSIPCMPPCRSNKSCQLVWVGGSGFGERSRTPLPSSDLAPIGCDAGFSWRWWWGKVLTFLTTKSALLHGCIQTYRKTAEWSFSM